MNRYSAQKQYWKAKQTKQDKEKIADVVLLQKLQVCAGQWGAWAWGTWYGGVRDWRTALGV